MVIGLSNFHFFLLMFYKIPLIANFSNYGSRIKIMYKHNIKNKSITATNLIYIYFVLSLIILLDCIKIPLRFQYFKILVHATGLNFL